MWLFIKGCGGRDQSDNKISRWFYVELMPKGLKSSSSQIVISGSVTESAPNIFTQGTVDLQLNVLDREVFVVTAVDLDGGVPDGIAATNTRVQMSMSTTNRTTIGTIADSNVVGAVAAFSRAAGFADATAAFMHIHPDSPTGADLDYIAIIATNDFFVQIEGTNNLAVKVGNFRVWGYRAVADASTFAALTQSELLSA